MTREEEIMQAGVEARELMIGDWVQHASGKYFQITRLVMWGDGSVHFACGHPHLWEYNNKFTPIPLTAEILEKNGFGYKEEDGNLWHYYLGERGYLANPDLHIVTYNKGVYWLNYCNNAIYGIKYIHELQHALRLCGIEKEIEL